ncbi:unnamed protein product [Alopecurus aequalis]
MTEMEDALRSCTEQLLLVREENESLIIEAANKISSEQKKSRDLLHKLEAANKRFAKVATENYNLQNTVNSKDKLIRELNESKAHSEQRLTEATARLEFMQKQCASLQYEARMVQKELEIRNKEREYDLQSIDAAQKQQQESLQKIIALEAECQRLRTMLRKRLPGPAAMVKMKEEVEQRGTSSVENGLRRTRTSTTVQPSLRSASRRHSESEGYHVKLQEMDDENRHLRELLARKESEIQSAQLQYADEACKLSVVQRQLKELWGDQDLEENNNSDQFSSPLVSKPEQLRTGTKQSSLSQSRRIAGTDMQLLVDLAEIEKLEMPSRPSSEPHQCGTDASVTNSKMVPSEILGRDQILEDGFFDKYPELIQDVLKLIIHKHQANKISVDVILDEVTSALRSESSAKENDSTGLPYHQAEIHSMVATLIERISCMIERNTGNIDTSCQLFFREKTELTSQLEHLVHVCSDVLEGKANLQKFIDEVCLTLEWVLNQCFFCIGELDSVDYITNKASGNDSVRTVNVHEIQAMHSANSEMVSGVQQELQKEPVGTTGDVPETRSQIQFAACKIDEELLSRQQQSDNCQENQSVYLEAESAVADGSTENLPEAEGKQPPTNFAISAAAEKLAECQETTTNLSKQLQALQTPENVGASGRGKPGTLRKVLAEEDAKPDDFSSPGFREVAWKKQQGGRVATEKEPVHEQGADRVHIAGNTGTRQATVPLVIPRSPRITFSADMKKKRRASLLGRFVFRKKA